MVTNQYDRICRMRQCFKNYNIDGLLVSKPENLFYLSGFKGSVAYFIITPNRAKLVVDFRYHEQAESQTAENEIEVICTEGPFDAWLPKLLDELRITRLGVESEYITVGCLDKWQTSLKSASHLAKIIPHKNIVETLREIKGKEEIILIKKAIELTESALSHVWNNYLKPGISEKQIAWEIEKYIKESGGELAFPVIAVAGPSSSQPHAQPSDRKIQSEEPIVIDMGAKLNGYCADITRTFWLGEEDVRFKQLYDMVLNAQNLAIKNITNDTLASDADRFVREYLVEKGFTSEFGHGLGHGLGLEVHESPNISGHSKDRLRNDMVFTVEPGIYIHGWGGIRIEDDVLLDYGRIQLLTHFQK